MYKIRIECDPGHGQSQELREVFDTSEDAERVAVFERLPGRTVSILPLTAAEQAIEGARLEGLKASDGRTKRISRGARDDFGR